MISSRPRSKDRPRAVLFDLDGVLLDSEPLHFTALNAVLRQHGHSVTEPEFFAFLGQTNRTAWKHWVKHFDLPEHIEVYVAAWDEAVVQVIDTSPVNPSPGAIDLVRSLVEREVRLAVASSSSRRLIRCKLAALGLTQYFQTVVGADDISRSKPDPQIFQIAAQRLRVPAANCLVIEDSPNGISAGKRAGMRVLAVRTQYTAGLSLAEADRIVDSLEEIDF
jgi:HAD superfamily hydrolase (TIGR01509 family)